jgi:DNA-directed RNA polymerase specialized sigma24 family protein
MPGTQHDVSSGLTSRPALGANPRFVTTRWSVVLHARQDDSLSNSTEAALALLCQAYWFPLYAHVRRRGFSVHDAEDLTQEFLARTLARRTIAAADPARGRFRTFMLTALDHFLADARDRARTLKRGGAIPHVSIDLADAEERFARIADPGLSPDRLFDREWALTLLTVVLDRLEREYTAAGRSELFIALKPTLLGARAALPYGELALQLNRSEGAVKVAVHRLRQRYRALLEAEVAETVSTDDDIRDELRALLQAVGA